MPLPLLGWAAIAAGSAVASYLGYKAVDEISTSTTRTSYNGEAEARARREAEAKASRERQAQAEARRERRRQQALEGGLKQLRHELKPLGMSLMAQATAQDVTRFAEAQPADIKPQIAQVVDGLSQMTGLSRSQLDDFGLLLDSLSAHLDYDPQQGAAAQLKEARRLQQQLDRLTNIQHAIREVQRS